MKIFLDTEFLEGTQKTRKEKTLIAIILGFCAGLAVVSFLQKHFFDFSFFVIAWTVFMYLYGKAKDKTANTIDLISIGIVSEDDREYYAISKDFNLKEAWNRYQWTEVSGSITKPKFKEYWIRENVLRPIFEEFLEKERAYVYKAQNLGVAISGEVKDKFTYRRFKKLLKKYGKTNKEIAKEIEEFVYNPESVRPMGTEEPIEFYAYYADYDWVVFCWLFGKMIDLPKGFPMYCRDLKQMLDEEAENMVRGFAIGDTDEEKERMVKRSIKGQLKSFKTFAKFPFNEGKHSAIHDARWGKKLYEFINTLK